MNEVINDWRFTRSETLELLNALSNEALAFTPKGKHWQCVAYQFACIGRTQLVYTKALETGVMDFAEFSSLNLPDKQELRKHDDLLKLLTEADARWVTAIKTGKKEIEWPGSAKSVASHVSRLVAHERIHHGQLISYFTLAGWDLPPKFKKNWAL